MPRYTKKSFPVGNIRRFLEPGPIVMVSSAFKGRRDIMTMGWHMVAEFSPSLIACFIWDQNDSQELIRRSKQCVINIPEVSIIDQTVAVGNSHGSEGDKFEKIGLTAVDAKQVDAPMIGECFANFECKLVDTSWVNKHSIFVLECVYAHVATRPTYPKTFHYRGEGLFMISGKTISRRKLFRPEML